jgi:hypothetical protein
MNVAAKYSESIAKPSERLNKHVKSRDDASELRQVPRSNAPASAMPIARRVLPAVLFRNKPASIHPVRLPSLLVRPEYDGILEIRPLWRKRNETKIPTRCGCGRVSGLFARRAAAGPDGFRDPPQTEQRPQGPPPYAGFVDRRSDRSASFLSSPAPGACGRGMWSGHVVGKDDPGVNTKRRTGAHTPNCRAHCIDLTH